MAENLEDKQEVVPGAPAVSTGQVVDETVKQVVEGTPVPGTPQPGTPVESTETPVTSPESPDEFDAASYESSFGLPAGELDGIENAEDALKAIRSYTDKTLVAGLGSGAKADPVIEAAKVAAETPAAKALTEATKTVENKAIDELRAELKVVTTSLAARAKKDYDRAVNEINQRADIEIDAWKSPMYGTTKSRDFRQSKSVRELNDLVQTHIAGFEVQGKSPPTVESLLRQVRTFHDENYTPTVERLNSEAVLGSPGTTSNIAKKTGGPANIHEALMGNSY